MKRDALIVLYCLSSLQSNCAEQVCLCSRRISLLQFVSVVVSLDEQN